MGNGSAFGLRTVNVSCFGMKNGVAFICAEVSDDVTITWRKGATIIKGPTTFTTAGGDMSDMVSGLDPGDYTVEWSSDGDGATIPFTITQPPQITLKLKKEKACCSNFGGRVRVIAKNAQSPVSYTWKNLAGRVVSTSRILKNIKPGVYSVTVTDGNGCKAFACTEVFKVCCPKPINTPGGCRARKNKCGSKKEKSKSKTNKV